MAINLISETENGCQGMFQGARASGVWFSASRRKPRRTNFSPLEVCGSVSDESSGATPELARGARALPIPISEFGIKSTRLVAANVSSRPINRKNPAVLSEHSQMMS
jgi:hypothetical protein